LAEEEQKGTFQTFQTFQAIPPSFLRLAASDWNLLFVIIALGHFFLLFDSWW